MTEQFSLIPRDVLPFSDDGYIDNLLNGEILPGEATHIKSRQAALNFYQQLVQTAKFNSPTNTEHPTPLTILEMYTLDQAQATGNTPLHMFYRLYSLANVRAFSRKIYQDLVDSGADDTETEKASHIHGELEVSLEWAENLERTGYPLILTKDAMRIRQMYVKEAQQYVSRKSKTSLVDEDEIVNLAQARTVKLFYNEADTEIERNNAMNSVLSLVGDLAQVRRISQHSDNTYRIGVEEIIYLAAQDAKYLGKYEFTLANLYAASKRYVLNISFNKFLTNYERDILAVNELLRRVVSWGREFPDIESEM